MKRLAILACLVASPCLAQNSPPPQIVVPGNAAETAAQTVADNDLAKAFAACSVPHHHHREQVAGATGATSGWVRKYNPGWEHCTDIEKAYADSQPARVARQRAAQEEAERQQSLGIASKLKSQP